MPSPAWCGGGKEHRSDDDDHGEPTCVEYGDADAVIGDGNRPEARHRGAGAHEEDVQQAAENEQCQEHTHGSGQSAYIDASGRGDHAGEHHGKQQLPE